MFDVISCDRDDCQYYCSGECGKGILFFDDKDCKVMQNDKEGKQE